ncbi:OmpA family protein [Acetobacteraceae bacterium H6797]|nr:OmpA family protein [Acetobacteraceae bacterium H6797]
MSMRHALLAATMLTLPAVAAVSAHAEQISGFYVGAGAGLNLSRDTDVSPSSYTGGGADLSFKPGVAAVVSAGWGFGNGLRAEIEGNYRYNNVDDGNIPAFGSPGRAKGHNYSFGAMANVLYDFDLGLPMGITPYIGGGVGYAWLNYQSVRLTGSNPFNRLDIVGSDGAFAYQGIAGIAMPITSVPGLSFTAEYRYFATLEQSLKANRVIAGSVASRKVDVDYGNHSIMIGLRYAFGQPAAPVMAPAPAPVVTPAPAPARTYLVFFDFDSSQLTDRARQITSEAAQNSKRQQVTRIEVSGHADRSGTPQYNQALSMRRANAVAAELERLGVSRSSMSIQAFGESRPLVPTADGVREPQNRRVEIVLR